MKRILAMLLAITMLFLLVACGEKENNENADGNATTNQTQSAENKDTETTDGESSAGKIVNDDGEEFTADVSAPGKLKEGAESLNSNKFELAGTTYTFPIKMSELFDNGWDLSKGYEYQTEFDANTKTNLVSYYLIHESGMRIHLDQMTNDSAEKKDIKECLLTGFSIQTYDLKTESDYTLPGGIVPMSNAANVIEAFGNPNTTTEFTGYSYNLEEQLTYAKHASSNISYSFSFNEDGTIYAVHIDYEV